MIVVWKFEFPLANEFVLQMPIGARPVTAVFQNGRPCMWAIVNPDESTEDRFFAIRGTGKGLSGKSSYLTTFLDGSFVWHLFEVRSTE